MEQENITEKLLQYIDGLLDAEEMASVQYWIESNEEIKSQYEQLKSLQDAIDDSQVIPVPSGQMTNRFEDWLDNQNNKRIVTLPNRVWSIAAAVAFLLVSSMISWSVYSNLKQKRELMAVKAQLDETKKILLAQMQNSMSASTRMTAVHASLNMSEPDDEIIAILTKTLNEDPNSNVRMASLEALAKIYSLPQVRSALVSSMKYQKDPIVQIALIQLLVQMKEKSILGELQNITEQTGTLKAVKDEAYTGIFKLT